jgi:hypothetical protein
VLIQRIDGSTAVLCIYSLSGRVASPHFICDRRKATTVHSPSSYIAIIHSEICSNSMQAAVLSDTMKDDALYVIVLLEVFRWTRGKAVLNSTSIISNDSRHWLCVVSL